MKGIGSLIMEQLNIFISYEIIFKKIIYIWDMISFKT
jgi:hypothetical protein